MNEMAGKIATVFGGTGFLGRQVVKELAARGVRVKVVTRVPERVYKLKTSGDVGQIVPFACDYSSEGSVEKVIRGSDLVVNCIGILYEKGKKQTFQRLHVELPAMIAKLCTEEGISRFVHISALGCNAGISRYSRSKLEGENVVMSHCPKATIIRPGVIFGREDNFFNLFAGMIRSAPFMPLIGGGKTKLQPVYVGDVAKAVVKALDLATDKYIGNTYQLGGSEVMDFKDIYAFISRHTGRECRPVTLPFKIAKYLAWSMEFSPRPLLTRDQVNSLKTDSIVSEGGMDFRCFDIMPKSVNLVVPEYLERFRKYGQALKIETIGGVNGKRT